MFKVWLKKFLAPEKLTPPQDVPEDDERKQKRLEAEKLTLRSMRRLAINESDPQFLSYVVQRESELDRLIDAQLDDEFDVMTAKPRLKPRLKPEEKK